MTSIEDALTALQEAVERKKMQMQNFQPQSGVASTLVQWASKISGGAAGGAQVLARGRQSAQRLVAHARQNIRQRPWCMLRRAAVYGFAAGFLLGRCRRRPVREKE